MTPEKKINPTKQRDLYEWIFEESKKESYNRNKVQDSDSTLVKSKKPKLAFGFGYDSNQLKKGVLKYSYSHDLENGLKLYEFEPKLSYRIFNVLANILRYKCLGSELRHNNTSIKNRYFITDENPEEVIEKLNYAINEIFEKYEPAS